MGVFLLAYYYRIVLHAQSRAGRSQRVSEVNATSLIFVLLNAVQLTN